MGTGDAFDSAQSRSEAQHSKGERHPLRMYTHTSPRVSTNGPRQAFFLYQIVYKFASGISKIATCFILLAIASPHQTAFIYFCRGLVVFILGYCVICSLVTIFQCGTAFESNWIHSNDQVGT